jgi:MFS family permease
VSAPATRFVMVAVPASLYLLSYFHRVAPAVVAADLMRAFGISAAALAQLAAVYPYVFVAMALVAGSLADGIGPRWTLALGGVGMAFGAALFGLAPSFSIAVVGRLVVGLGASVVLIAWLSLIAAWLRPDEFATAAGWTQAVGNIGALAASSPLALLVEGIGWRHTFVVIGAATLLLTLVTLLVVRDRPPASITERPRRADGMAGVLAGVRSIVANRRTWPPVLAAGGMFATILTLQGLWGVSWLSHVYGMSRVQAATTLAMLALGFAVGSPLAGWLSDRWLGVRRVPFIVFAMAYALCWAPLLLDGPSRVPASWLPPFLFVMGVAGGGLALVFPYMREVNDPARVGLAVGFCNIPMFLGFALLQAMSGLVLDARWQGLAVDGARLYPESAYRALFAMCAAVAASSGVATTLLTETHRRNVSETPR